MFGSREGRDIKLYEDGECVGVATITTYGDDTDVGDEAAELLEAEFGEEGGDA